MKRDFSRFLARLETRRADYKRRTSESGPRREFGGLYPPAPAEAIRRADEALGFPLPAALTAIYRKLANGGFGPGFGILGVEGGYTDPDLGGLTLIEFHQWILGAAKSWPHQLLTVCNLGGNTRYAIECGQPECPVYLVEGIAVEQRVGPFEDVMENWAAGRD